MEDYEYKKMVMALLDCGYNDVDFIGELLNYDRFDVDVFDIVTKMRNCGYGINIDSFITCIYLVAIDNAINELGNIDYWDFKSKILVDNVSPVLIETNSRASALYIYHKNRDDGTEEIFDYEELKEFLKKEYTEI